MIPSKPKYLLKHVLYLDNYSTVCADPIRLDVMSGHLSSAVVLDNEAPGETCRHCTHYLMDSNKRAFAHEMSRPWGIDYGVAYVAGDTNRRENRALLQGAVITSFFWIGVFIGLKLIGVI